MYCYLLQDWITVRGAPTPPVTFTQPENGYFDASGFQDIVIWLDIKEGSFGSGGSLAMAYQTAATKDEMFFVTMGSVQNASAAGITTTAMLKDTTPVPIARWLRWQVQVSSGTVWDMTFRIFCALNAIGANRPKNWPKVG
jgi:hypothetical protein